MDVRFNSTSNPSKGPINSRPLSRRAQNGQARAKEFSNLYLNPKKTEEAKVTDAQWRSVEGEVQQPKLGQNPHKVDSFAHHSAAHHRNGFQAHQGMKKPADTSKLGNKNDWDKLAKKSSRSFETSSGDKVTKDAPAYQSMEDRIAGLEAKVSQLQDQVSSDRFTANPNVSFPESVSRMSRRDGRHELSPRAPGSTLPDRERNTAFSASLKNNNIGLA